MSEIIKVAFVNQPKTPTAKSGNIKTEDGRYLGVFKDKLSQFTVGQSYEVETKSREYNGKTYVDITTFKPVNGSNGDVAHHVNSGSGSVSRANGSNENDGARWGNAKACAAQLMSGTNPSFSEYLALARMIYAATPTEVTAESTTDNGGDW